jgi:hypothetical protein
LRGRDDQCSARDTRHARLLCMSSPHASERARMRCPACRGGGWRRDRIRLERGRRRLTPPSFRPRSLPCSPPFSLRTFHVFGHKRDKRSGRFRPDPSRLSHVCPVFVQSNLKIYFDKRGSGWWTGTARGRRRDRSEPAEVRAVYARARARVRGCALCCACVGTPGRSLACLAASSRSGSRTHALFSLPQTRPCAAAGRGGIGHRDGRQVCRRRGPAGRRCFCALLRASGACAPPHATRSMACTPHASASTAQLDVKSDTRTRACARTRKPARARAHTHTHTRTHTHAHTHTHTHTNTGIDSGVRREERVPAGGGGRCSGQAAPRRIRHLHQHPHASYR